MAMLDAETTLLIVDDNPDNLRVLSNFLINSGFEILVAVDGESAIQKAIYAQPDLILLDIMMPILDGIQACIQLKANEKTRHIPVIFMSALSDTESKLSGFEAGGVDYITKPFQREEVLARVNTHLSLQRLHRRVAEQNTLLEKQNEVLENRVLARTQELQRTRMQVIHSLGKAAEYRDNDTGMHVVRMSKCAAYLAKLLDLSDAECDIILHASPMHDVGKIAIPDSILLKPGKLTEEEWVVMRQHTVLGEQILASSDNDSALLKAAAVLARSHHEKWDGTGYPDGLKGEAIPLISRINSICDVFDALLSKRPYKEPWPVENAVTYIEAQRGKHFEPQIVDIFLTHLADILSIRAQYADRDEQ